MRDAPVDQQPPDRFGDLGRQVVRLRGRQHLGHHVVDPGLVEDGVAVAGALAASKALTKLQELDLSYRDQVIARLRKIPGFERLSN